MTTSPTERMPPTTDTRTPAAIALALALAALLVHGASALEGDDAKTHNDRGVVLAEKKQFKEAEAEFRKAIQLKPDYALAYLNLGTALSVQQKFDEAVTASRKSPLPSDWKVRRPSLVKLKRIEGCARMTCER